VCVCVWSEVGIACTNLTRFERAPEALREEPVDSELIQANNGSVQDEIAFHATFQAKLADVEPADQTGMRYLVKGSK
jgi:hypothetical protein